MNTLRVTDAAPESAAAKGSMYIARPQDGWSVHPLDALTIIGAGGVTLVVLDGEGREYLRVPAAPVLTFTVAGRLGTQTIKALDAAGATLDSLTFTVDAVTGIDDAGGRFHDLLQLLYKTMCCYHPDGVASIRYDGKDYPHYVHWILDHVHTAKGMQYFAAATRGLIDLFGLALREDGMIWSFAFPEAEDEYHFTAYAPHGYAKRAGGLIFGRQPVENHNEANFVDGLYLSWKGNGDDAWMASHLDAAVRALNYSASDACRWSSALRLLKKGYTIDSWDFQVEDQHTAHFPLATAQMIDSERTNFGIFFGDNTGYMLACSQLAEMLQAAGRAMEAEVFRLRGAAIHQRLTALAWNGRFFTHHVEENPAIQHDLGVDESTQMAMSNAYSLNRCISHEQCVAIINSYQQLRANLPAGSPGEWYAIYPPFQRGFGGDNDVWQYMNGGVQPHAAGELARGAFEHGFEGYGADILLRLRDLAHQYDNVLHFAYTGAADTPPPPQAFTPISLAGLANMDITDAGAEGVPAWLGGGDAGNDLRNLPVGAVTLAEVPYLVTDPAANGRRSAVAVARQPGLPAEVEVPLQAKAGALYLLHVAAKVAPSGIAGAVTLRYADGSVATTYMMSGTHLTGYWFPTLATPTSGIAWRGTNERCSDIGVSWAALANPHPEKTIDRVIFTAALDGALYTVLGLTLADRLPFTPHSPISFGGPDNWGGGTCAYALIQGLAGVKDTDRALQEVRLSPRWIAADVDDVAVTVRYPASQGYLAYQYRHDAAAKQFTLRLSGSGDTVALRLLLPDAVTSVEAVHVEGAAVPFSEEQVEGSRYLCLPVAISGLVEITVAYRA